MNQEIESFLMGEDYADLLVFYLNQPSRLKEYQGAYIHYMNEVFAVIHVPVSQITENAVNNFGYAAMPKLFGPSSTVGLETSGVNRFRAAANTDFRGEGVLIGIVDTGIDYTNPVFLKADGNTKIVSIWDQTIETGNSPYETGFGTAYPAERINEALASSNPFDVVPSRDENGHGTMMAAVAAGNENLEARFGGVAPDSELVIVKLKQAKKYLRDFFIIPDHVDCFQENHIMWGVQYCFQLARDLNRPIIICLGVETSQGSHDGQSLLDIFLSIIGDFPGTAVITSAGNEGNQRRHFYGTIDPAVGYQAVDLNVGVNDTGFSMELWGNSPGMFSLDIVAPSGEHGSQIVPSLRSNRVVQYIFERTQIAIDYQMTQSITGDQLILMRYHNISPGIWRLNVHGLGDLKAGFHIWLPAGNFITNETYFLQPNTYTTVTGPGNSAVPICATSYNALNDSLFFNAGRGYTRSNIVKPEIAAPGVNYMAPNNHNEFIPYTGSSVAAAHTAGIAALIMEWGVVLGNQPDLDTVAIKSYLLRGAKRSTNLVYPNRDWGFGILDIYNVFNIFRTEVGN